MEVLKLIESTFIPNKDEQFLKLQEQANEECIKRKVMQDIIKIVEYDPSCLENLDAQKLEVIDNYYSEKIAECKAKLSRISG